MSISELMYRSKVDSKRSTSCQQLRATQSEALIKSEATVFKMQSTIVKVYYSFQNISSISPNWLNLVQTFLVFIVLACPKFFIDSRFIVVKHNC